MVIIAFPLPPQKERLLHILALFHGFSEEKPTKTALPMEGRRNPTVSYAARRRLRLQELPVPE